MGDREAKDALYDGFAEMAKALASGRRVEIVDLLAQGERSVDEIAREIGQSVANTSLHHLRAMARAGLLTTRRHGTRICYALASDHVAQLWSALRHVAEQHVAGLERLAGAYLGERDGVEVVDRRELAARLRRGEVFVLDVRPPAEFAAGHINGARSVPIGELRRHLRALPKDAEVVAYCRGPYCVYADDAVRQLNRHGFRARRLVDGFPEWKRAGLPVATGEGEKTMTEDLLVEAEALREQVREKYRTVAVDPHQTFHFHTGRPLAKRLGYDDGAVDALPDRAVESFAGVGNPFSLRPLSPGERVVDVGSGAGFDSFIAARQVGDTGYVIGVDMTPEMLRKSSGTATTLGLANVEFREGLAEQLPVEDGWADVVISNGVINLCADKHAVFTEIRRVLRPGGWLQFADIANGRPVPPEALRDIDLWTG